MRTISEIQGYCLSLDQNNMAGHPLLLSDEEITMLYNAFCSKEDAERKDDYVGGCRGSFMGHPIFSKSDWPGSQLWSASYVFGPTTASDPIES